MYSIVLIDDERWMLEQMWRILEWGSLDCKITGEFTDAQKALAEIARLAPDIILCDISMPSMSGLDFLDELLPCQPAVAVLVVPAKQQIAS